MKIRANQQGFSPVEVIIVVVVIGLLSFAGYTVYDRQQTKTADNSTTGQPAADTSQSPTASDVSNAPNISSASDLDKASQTLDKNDPGASNNTDSTQLNGQLAAF